MKWTKNIQLSLLLTMTFMYFCYWIWKQTRNTQTPYLCMYKHMNVWNREGSKRSHCFSSFEAGFFETQVTQQLNGMSNMLVFYSVREPNVQVHKIDENVPSNMFYHVICLCFYHVLHERSSIQQKTVSLEVIKKHALFHSLKQRHTI